MESGHKVVFTLTNGVIKTDGVQISELLLVLDTRLLGYEGQ